MPGVESQGGPRKRSLGINRTGMTDGQMKQAKATSDCMTIRQNKKIESSFKLTQPFTDGGRESRFRQVKTRNMENAEWVNRKNNNFTNSFAGNNYTDTTLCTTSLRKERM